VVDFDIPITRLIWLLVKLAIALLPAAVILAAGGFLALALLASLRGLVA